MPRTRRIVVPDYPHHIVQRGHNREAVFASAADYRAYLETLAEFREALSLKVYGYCLMTNHVHLIVDPGHDAEAVSVLMNRLAARHTRRVNGMTGRTGTAWEGRFKCSPIGSDRYLMACARYVDLNPVRAGIVRNPQDYRWSSYRAKIGLVECDWLDADPGFTALSDTLQRRRERYREFVLQEVNVIELEAIRMAVRRNQLTGSDEFVERIKESTGRHVPSRAPGRPRHHAR